MWGRSAIGFETGMVVQIRPAGCRGPAGRVFGSRRARPQETGHGLCVPEYGPGRSGSNPAKKLAHLPVEKTFPVPEPEDLIRTALLHGRIMPGQVFGPVSGRKKVSWSPGQYLPKPPTCSHLRDEQRGAW